ncbi:MAG: hypothetical protein WCT50_04540 [Patescibacteria group bacterium]
MFEGNNIIKAEPNFEKEKQAALRLKIHNDINEIIEKFYQKDDQNNKDDVKQDLNDEKDEYYNEKETPDLVKWIAQQQKLDLKEIKIIKAREDASNEGQKVKELIFELRKLDLNYGIEGDSFSFDRAWSQEQVDKIVDILSNYLDNNLGQDKKYREPVISDSGLGHFFYEVFTTGNKTRNDREEFKGKTIADLFAKSIINRLESEKNISGILQEAIGNWAQNIHMVDKDILLDLLLTISQHPEKIDTSIRHEIIMGVGLFETLVKPLNELAKDKKDFPSQLKSLEILRSLYACSDEAGFSESGGEAERILEEREKDNSNYFLNIRVKQILEEHRMFNREKRLKMWNKYKKEDLKENAPEPLLLENLKGLFAHLRERMMYGSVSKETGVIYNSNGEVDSFFDIEKGERLDLKKILENDGFVETENNKEKSQEKMMTYKILMQIPLRYKIEEEFEIELDNFSIREQLQFINFISSKSVSEVQRVKEFISGANTKSDKNNRFVSFLSLEADSDMGDKIIEIGEKLNMKSQSADLLFAKYAQLTRQLTKDVDSFEEFYQSIFFEKNIKRGELIKLFLIKSGQLLSSVHENIKNLSSEESEEEVGLLINNLDSEIIEKTANLKELKKIALALNEKYNNLGQDLMVALDPEMVDYKQFEEDLLNNNNLTPEIKNSLKDDLIRHRNYDSDRLKEMLEYYKTVLKEDVYCLSEDKQTIEEFSQENEKFERGEISPEEFKAITKKYNVIFYAPTAEEKSIYEKAINKIKPILPLQIALEKKIDQLIYGREELKLSKGFCNFENNKVIPEKLPEQAPLYFPVGISKDLPAWEKVLKNEEKFVKPIDLYGYLFWLNNQEKNINLVICDELQVNNYQARYGKSEDEARQSTIKIGNLEAEQYQKIINTFGLDNIKIQRYQEFLNENREEFERYSDVVKKLAIQPSFREAFLAMVQESVSGAEKEEYIGYALEELAWILSTNGTKIGHLNEARYDILAIVIRNFEKIGRNQGLEVLNNPDSPEAKILLNTVCKITRDGINERKSKLEKNSPSLAYFQRLQDHLGKINIDPKIGYDQSIKKDSLSLNFACPEVGSASFGWRGNFEAKESVVKFKEPYSTYFYKTDSDLLINSDQVVAAGEGLIGGKILTLDSKQQLKYAESVVIPILKHYFITLEKAPAKYFEDINISREGLLAEAQEATSLLSILRFIQKYIVKPTALS